MITRQKADNEDEEWVFIQPKVNAEAEFFEILNDFGNPLEILREGISNAIDAGATWIKISFDVEEIDGTKRLVIILFDNGLGMSREVLERDFWGLGYSPSRDHKNKIGEKGHGTKIYLRSERVIANTDPKILEELRLAVQQLVNQIDTELYSEGLYTLRGWQEEERTIQQENAEYSRRVKSLKSRKIARLEGRLLTEPQNESELFGLFIIIYAMKPELFEFEPLDYNTSRGIDIIARNKGRNRITEGEHWYVELKHTLRTRFNHAYQNLRWIVCWDFDKNIGVGSEFHGVEDADIRRLETGTDDEGHSIYFLDNKKRATKIQIIRLKEYLKQRLNLEFEFQDRMVQSQLL